MTNWVQFFSRRSRLLLVGLLAAAILHICATLAAPQLATKSAFNELGKLAGLHKMLVLPTVAPGASSQPLRFMPPDARYAICRFDTSKGIVSVAASLPDKGWTLNLYSGDGENVYTALGQDSTSTEIRLTLVPADDRFLGLTPEASGRISDGPASLRLTANQGVVVIRAPDRGYAYRGDVDAKLKRANCSARLF